MSVEEFYNDLISNDSANISILLDINSDNNLSVMQSTGSTNNRNNKVDIPDAIHSNYNEDNLLIISSPSLRSSSLSDLSSSPLSGSSYLHSPSPLSRNSVSSFTLSSSPSLSSFSCKSLQDLSLSNSESFPFSGPIFASTSEIDETVNNNVSVFEYIVERSLNVFMNSGKIIRQNKALEIKDEIDINKYMLFEAYLHKEDEISKVKYFSQKGIFKTLLNCHRKTAKSVNTECDNFAISGNSQVFEREVIELNSISGFNNNNSIKDISDLSRTKYGSPSAIAHDNNGLLFIGTIRGYIVTMLDVSKDKCLLLFDPSEDLVSKISSISVAKTENKDYVYLSVARVDGSIFIWKINSQLVIKYLKGNEDSEDIVLKESIFLINKSIRYIKQGILNHDFIDIRNQSLSKLALFVSDLQGNLFVLLLEQKNSGNNESIINENSWVIADNIFLYHSTEELIHEFRPFPAPPLIKSSAGKMINNSVNKRDVIPMDYYQLYLISSKRKFSIISMLPHPALCKVVDVYEDLKSKNIPIGIGEDDNITFLHSNWLRPSVIFKDTNSAGTSDSVKHPIKILISIDRYLCIYEIESFIEYKDSDEIDIEINLTTVLELFDTINGIKVISDNLISLLIGFNGVYIYQLMENTESEGLNITIKVNDTFSDFNIVKSFRGVDNIDSNSLVTARENANGSNNSILVNKNKLGEFYPVISNVYREKEDIILVCIYKYGQKNKKLLVVSQNTVNDFNETIQLFNYSLITCTSINNNCGNKANKVILLLNDKVITFTMLFKSWMTYLESEYNKIMEQLKQGDTNVLSWVKHSSIFIALFENRLPPLLTWKSISRETILVIIRNIFNSLLNNVVVNHLKSVQIEDKGKFVLVSNYTRKIIGLIVDSSSRLLLWEYLFSEIIPIVKTYGDVSILIEDSEREFNMTLFDYYIKLIVFKFVSGEIEWKYINYDIISVIIDWYGAVISICDREGRLNDKQALLSEVEYLMIKTLKYGVANVNEEGNTCNSFNCHTNGKDNNNPWLKFVPIFKNNNLWTSYITLYLYNGRELLPLFKRIILVLLNDYYLVELNGENSQKFNIIDYQYKIESDSTIHKFYHFIFSFLFKSKYPFNEYIRNYENSNDMNFELDYNTHDLIKLMTSKVSNKSITGVNSINYIDVLILTSIRIYVNIILELNNRKNKLLLVHNENDEEKIDKLIVCYEKLSLIMQDRLEAFVFFNIKNHNNINNGFILAEIREDFDQNIDFKNSILEMLLSKKYSKMNLDVYYMAGHYIMSILNNLDKYNVNDENSFIPIIKCIFTLIRKLNFGICESKEMLFSLVNNIEYYLIMAIIRNNKNNQGINFLVLINNNIDFLDNECYYDDLSNTNKVEIVSNDTIKPVNNIKVSDLEANQRISLILKKYSFYNLSLYLSIQVFDLENILDIFSKEKYINNNILKELYIIDDNNNNLLFSFSYIMSTIEKGIKFNVFDYNHVLNLIIKYADLLSNIDSLNTIDLIINILEKCMTTFKVNNEVSCLNSPLSNEDNQCINYYNRILRNELDGKLYRLLLDSLLFNGGNIYKKGNNYSKWNSFINNLLSDYLEMIISEVKLSLNNINNHKDVTENKVLMLLDHWYKNFILFDELINVPLDKFFNLLEKNDLPLGMIYINHIFMINPTLCKTVGEIGGYSSIVNSCIYRFEEYLNSLSSILNSNKYNKETFKVNIKGSNDNNSIIIILNDSEMAEKADIYHILDNILELSSFLYIYCFSNNDSQTNNMDFLGLYAALIKTLFSNMDKYIIEYFNNNDNNINIEKSESSIVNVIGELIKTANLSINGNFHLVSSNLNAKHISSIKSSSCGNLTLNGTQMMIVLYYILAFHILGNEHYQYILQGYVNKYANISCIIFNGKLNEIFSNQITNYYNFIKPILLLIIKDANKIPCRFWRHLALNMINTRLFINKCNDQLTQLFQNDLVFLFNSLIDSSRKAVNIDLIREGGTENNHLVDGYNSDVCYICKQWLYNIDDLNNYSRGVGGIYVDESSNKAKADDKNSFYFNLKVVSEGTNNFYLFNNDYYGKAHYIENIVEDLNGVSTENNFELEKLLVFSCGNVFHKECYYKAKQKFGIRSGENDLVYNKSDSSNTYCNEKIKQNIQCLHQYSASF
ncbi:large low complexity [Cryptosporidium xiaoi]|uniref:Large low complexity n=1 Tax=Cryptosporidium xiaoi TaxID=659607 RepID=A0AAV9XW90_9CRYT